MGSESYRSELVRLQKDLAAVRTELARQEDAASRARADAARKRKAAHDSKTMFTIQSNIRAAENEEKKVVVAEKRIGMIKRGRWSRSPSPVSRISSKSEPPRASRLTDLF
jgi:hypothetical protein